MPSFWGRDSFKLTQRKTLIVDPKIIKTLKQVQILIELESFKCHKLIFPNCSQLYFYYWLHL